MHQCLTFEDPHMIMPLQYTQIDTLYHVLMHLYTTINMYLFECNLAGLLIMIARLYCCLVSFRVNVRLCRPEYVCVAMAINGPHYKQYGTRVTVILVHHSCI